MEDKLKYVDNLVERAETYGNTTIELAKLKTVDKVADGVSTLVAWTPVIIAVILFFITLNFGIAYMVGDLVGKLYLGFLIVAAFYGLVGLILFVFKDKWIKKPLNNSMINQMLK